MYVILLLVVFVLFGVFAAQNGSTQDFTLLGYHWSLPMWTPTAIGTGIVSFLLLLHLSHTGMGRSLRRMGMGRELDTHRASVESLRAENGRLREELAAVRGEVRGASAGTAGARRNWLDSFRDMRRPRDTKTGTGTPTT
jgi:uncharacterized integral membrane protein